MTIFIINWIRRLISPRPGSTTPEDCRLDRVNGGLLLLGAFQGLTIGGALILLRAPSLAIVTIAFGAVSTTLLVYFRRGASAKRTSHLFLLAGLGATVVSRLTIGVSDGLLLPWFALVPVMAVMLLGWRGGLGWIAATCVSFVGLWIVGPWLVAHQPIVSDWWYDIEGTSRLEHGFAGMMAYLGLIIGLAAMSWSHEATRRLAAFEQGLINRRKEDIHAELGRSHDLARSLLDHVPTGILLVRRDGTIEPQFSKAATQMLGAFQPGVPLWQIFAEGNRRFADWLESCWVSAEDDWMPLGECLAQLPRQAVVRQRTLEIDLQLIDKDDPQSPVLCVFADVSDVVRSRAAEERARDVSTLTARCIQDHQLVASFLRESRRLVDGIASGTWGPGDQRRAVHTFKGSAAVMGLCQIATWLHGLEDRMAEGDGSCSREDRQALVERWADLAGALEPMVGDEGGSVIHLRREYLDEVRTMIEGDAGKDHLLFALERLTWEPVETRLYHLSAQANKLALAQGKSIECKVNCGDIRLPPNRAWNSLWASLVHVVRNAIDHGISDPQSRVAAGKSQLGHLLLSALRHGDDLVIEISDDGCGVNWDAVATKAAAQNLPASTQEDLVAALFSDGLSTKDEVTDISGRGVGLNAVWHAVCKLHGQRSRSRACRGRGSPRGSRYPPLWQVLAHRCGPFHSFRAKKQRRDAPRLK
ncbi:MAG: hypothetical protein GXP62_11075 [Oligoflexia bacterium]|nr:hypothetical protein [Oligoflexia bacterium]